MSRRVLRRALAVSLAVVICLLAGRPTHAASGPYRFANLVRLGVPTVDHAFDVQTGRVYLSVWAFPRGIYVVDTARPGLAGKFGDAPFGSIDIAPDLNELFVLSLTERRVRVIDLGTMNVEKTFEAPSGHAVFYEPSRQELYVLRADDKHINILSARTGQAAGSIALLTEPSFIIADANTKRVFVRLADHDAVQVLDPLEHVIVATWPLDTYGPSSMAIDPDGHRLFVSSADNVWMLDTRTGERLGKLALQYRVLGLAFDPATQLMMASTFRGLVVARAGATGLTQVQLVSEGMTPSALFLNPKTHAVFAVGSAVGDPRFDGASPLSQSSSLLVFEYR